MPLSEPLGALAIASDLATGRPRGSSLSAAIVATKMAQRMNLSIADQKAVYFLATVRYLGCTITSHEQAQMSLGDDQGFAVATMLGDWDDPEDLRAFLDEFIAPDAPEDARDAAFNMILEVLPAAAPDFTAAHCRQAFLIAKRLNLPDPVAECIPHYYARWDGQVVPGRAEEIPLVARVFRVAEMAELMRKLRGTDAAIAVIRAKAGRELDPSICEVLLAHADEIFDAADVVPEFEAFVAAEPGEPIPLTEKCAEVVSEVTADISDHKSVYFDGHSRRMGALASAAGKLAGLDADQVRRLRFAGLVHDVGKSAVSNRIWYKSGPLSVSERLEMETHSYQTEFILSHAEPLSQWAQLAASAHERADGSGYHKRIPLSDMAANILAAANHYDELTHDCAERKAMLPINAARELNALAMARKLLPTAVSAVLRAAGHRPTEERASYPCDLTRREVQVLGWLAKSETTAQVARALKISPKTADHHIQNIYNKTGIRARPALALFAMEHGIVSE